MIKNLKMFFTILLLMLNGITISIVSGKKRNLHTNGFDSLSNKILKEQQKLLLKNRDTIETSFATTDSQSGLISASTSSSHKNRLTQISSKTQPIRIHFDTTALQSTIDQTTNAQQKLSGQNVIDNILPKIAEHFSETISVEPSVGVRVTSDVCSNLFRNFIPGSFMDIYDVDIVIMVSGFTSVQTDDGEVEFCSDDPARVTLAAAISCGQESESYRPIVGLMNVCIAATVSNTDEEMEEILSHELLHVLVLSEYLFPFFRNALDGTPLSDPNTLQTIDCVNGADSRLFYGFSRNTLMYFEETVNYAGTTQKRGYYELMLPTVRNVVRNQFNCRSLTGARLENQPTNPNTCIGSHIDERLFLLNLMSAFYDTTSVHFTPITLALLEDSGWYKPKYEDAQNSPFGLNVGCDFVNKDCIVDGEVPEYSKGFFCNDVVGSSNKLSCDPGHNYRGYCDLYDYSRYTDLPTYPGRSYFDNKFLGAGKFTAADWCPTVIDSPTSTTCTDTSFTGSKDQFEVFGADSRCLNAIVGNSRTGLCLPSTCDYENEQYNFTVGDSVYSCKFGDAGIGVNLQQGGTTYRFTCPRLTQVCPDMFCPSMCSGKGVCDWNADPKPVCKCFDSSDTTAGCFESGPNDPTILQEIPDPNVGSKISRFSSIYINVSLVLVMTILIIW
mmetsp:Transcript_21981/g.25409  ORF Transcript_21981/g.25409 Transcript_21981/m.25409 type:complete len:669 (-) Transcript_21981:404-2410(-)